MKEIKSFDSVSFDELMDIVGGRHVNDPVFAFPFDPIATVWFNNWVDWHFNGGKERAQRQSA